MQTPQNQPKRVLVLGNPPAVSAASLIDRVGQLRGEFSLVVKNRAGEIVEVYEDKNLIVNLAKTTLAQLLGAATITKRVEKIAFGTSSISPDVSDSVITNSVVKSIDGVTYPEFNSTSFAWTLGYADANGLSISEFGLLSADGTLFARKTRTSPIAKTDDLLLTGTWKIVF